MIKPSRGRGVKCSIQVLKSLKSLKESLIGITCKFCTHESCRFCTLLKCKFCLLESCMHYLPAGVRANPAFRPDCKFCIQGGSRLHARTVFYEVGIEHVIRSSARRRVKPLFYIRQAAETPGKRYPHIWVAAVFYKKRGQRAAGCDRNPGLRSEGVN